jgi:decaprenylphospho-beta-D-erythro-pentofuranosid-2-ulose 2-reductase
VSNGHVYSTGRRVMVLGGTSEIALAIVRELQAQAPREVALLGRDREGLERAAAQLSSDGCQRIITLELNALATDRHSEMLDRAFAELGGADIVVLAVGVLGERGGLPSDIPAALEVLKVNTVGAGSLLIHSAQKLREQGGGTLVVLSSVAAERARRANVVYGASKAGLDALAQGLGDDLCEDGVQVLVVRPGFVHTRMTQDLPAAPLASTPEAVARAVQAGLDNGSQTIWVPGALRWLMLVMRMLPRFVFRRLKQ